MGVVEEAIEHAEREVKSPAPMAKREACDKAFLAVIKAVDEYLVARGYPEPERHGERFGYVRDLEKKDPRIAKIGLSERLGARFGLSHEACFYGGRIEFAEDEIKKSKALIKLIKDLPVCETQE
jgi:hypothetical protein